MTLKTIKCGWCGEYFTVETRRGNNAVKYCSPTCRREKRREQQREYTRKWRKRIQGEEHRNYLLGESRIDEHPNKDWKKELKIIQKEMRRIGI